MNVIECISLTKVFQDFWGRDKVRAVDDLDLEIHPGEVFGLLGPNGSGKSTTIKLLLGLLYPTSGAARVFKKPPTDTATKSRIGFMPEESYLYRYLNAYETLDYYGRLFKLDRYDRRRRIGQLIEMVGLRRAAKRPVGTYSKGMARRIGLAQALINDPDLLILDEPTTGLDPIGTGQIKEVIKTLGQRGKTVLLCSHLLADVEDVCDRVSIMYGGRRQAIGSVSELLQRQEITQITTEQLDEQTIEKIRELVAKSHRHVIKVDHPTDRLEDFFLRVVGHAQHQKLETSGAESTVGVSEFLTAGDQEETGVSLVTSLVEAGLGQESASEQELQKAGKGDKEPQEPVELPSTIKTDVLETLVAGKPSSGESTTGSPPSSTLSEDEPIEAPTTSRVPEESVINRLLQPHEDAAAEKPDDE